MKNIKFFVTPNKVNIKNFLSIFFTGLIVLFYLFFGLSTVHALSEENFLSLEDIKAVSAVVIDGETGKIFYAKNPDLKIPPASTLKLLTAMVVLDHVSPYEKVKISRNAASVLSSSPRLYPREVYTVKDLLYLMLMKSSNQAAVALAEKVAGSEKKFVVLMNKKAESLGLRNSYFATASGLPAPNQYTTPYEIALIFYEAMKYPLIRKIVSTKVKIITSLSGRTFVIKNTNKLLGLKFSDAKILGGKTGYTRASRHCLVNAAEVNGRLIITSVMGSPSRDTLWKDTLKLIKFSKLVLERKASPVLVITTVNTRLLASQKIISPYKYYKQKRKYYKKYYKKKKKR